MGLLELITLVLFLTNIFGVTSLPWLVVFSPLIAAALLYLILFAVYTALIKRAYKNFWRDK